ncbi:MAG: transposase [Coriobacteriaceae bacterium]|nr:MAG: transposase [Coriobacteriaceae bacterium]
MGEIGREGGAFHASQVDRARGERACLVGIRRDARGAHKAARARERHPARGGGGFKAASLDALTNREETLIIEHLRQTPGHALKDLTAPLRISKSSYEYQRAALARPDKYAELPSKIADIFEGANRSRGYRCATHELRELEEPIVVSEKVVRRTMREEGMEVTRERAGSHTTPTRGRSRMPRESGEARLRCRPPELPTAHRHHRVRHPCRKGLSQPCARLFRRSPACMVDLAGSGRGALRFHARGGMRRPGAGRASRHSQRPRLPLRMAWVDCDL